MAHRVVLKMKWFIIICLCLAATSAELTKSNNQFAATIYKEVLKKSQSNFLVSPFSVETVAAFAQSGCKDQTAQEIRAAVHLPDDKNKIEKDIKTVLSSIKGNYTFHNLYKMYVQENFRIKDEFKKSAKEIYHAETENIDFNRTLKAAQTMNNWVKEQTDNKISDLIDPNTLYHRSKVILLNGVYFKADWKLPFMFSYKKKFYRSRKDVIEVDSIVVDAHDHYKNYKFMYFECTHLKAKFLEIPFKGDDAIMTFVLPNEKNGLSAVENQIDNVFATKRNLTLQYVDVAIPKFKIETMIDFKDVLQNLGVKRAFDKNLADLSAISGLKGDLIIDKIIQKSFIGVSQKGVGTGTDTYSDFDRPLSGFRTPYRFIADHPFMFFIKIKDFIIFAGRVTDPK